MSNQKEIINFLRTEVNEQNIDTIISEILKRLNESGKEANCYISDIGGGKTFKSFKKIGPTRMGNWRMGGFLSSDKEFISDNILLNVMSGLGDEVNTSMGDCLDAYKMLITKLKNIKEINFESIMKMVYQTTKDYFGGVETVDVKERANYYYQVGEDTIGKISDLKGKNLAACTERAALSQNLLRFLGFNSVYKIGQISNEDSKEIHAYNLIENEGKYYLYDSTIPAIDEKREVTPIIAEIPKEVFETLSQPLNNDDISVKTERDSVRGHRKIHYNSWSQNIYDCSKRIQEREEEK